LVGGWADEATGPVDQVKQKKQGWEENQEEIINS